MLHDPLKYQTSRISTDKPLWHWAQLFEDHIPNSPRGTDLDRVSEYRGHFLFIEAKPVGGPLSRTQANILEKLSRHERNHVLLLGLTPSVDNDFRPQWSIACWTWINRYNWRDPKCRVVGGLPEFKVMMLAWRDRIDELEGQLLEGRPFISPEPPDTSPHH